MLSSHGYLPLSVVMTTPCGFHCCNCNITITERSPLSLFLIVFSRSVFSELLSVKYANRIIMGIAWSLREDRPSRLSPCVWKECEAMRQFSNVVCILLVFVCCWCLHIFVICTHVDQRNFYPINHIIIC